MSALPGEAIAESLRDCFLSSDLMTSSCNPATIVDAIGFLARAIDRLGNADAATEMGGLEALGKVVKDAAKEIAASLDNLADAVRERT